MRVLGFFLISIFSFQVFAADTAVISFYRNQESLFPSGQASRESLEKKILRRDFTPWFRVSWNKKSYEIPGETVVTDLQVTRQLIAKEALSLLNKNENEAPVTAKVAARTSLLVLQTKNHWAELVDLKKKTRGWAPLHLLEAPVEDTGVYLTLIDTLLRKNPENSSPVITTVPRMQRLVSLGIEKTYLKVKYQNHTGYLDLANLTGRADFAMWAFHRHKGWLGIDHRENAFLYTVNNQKLALDDFLAFKPYTDRGVVSQKLSEEGPSIRSRVEITHDRAHRWALSVLDGHGSVWWRMEDSETLAAKKAREKQISSEQLLKREVTDVAFATKSQMGLASAGGIFRTEDGKTWTQISMFEDKNYPVTIHPDGIWYVGNYRSFNEGKTFESYIRWDKLAEKIQVGLSKTPRHLRITSIEPLSHSRIRLLVDTGTQKVKMQAHVLSQEWALVK